MIFFLRTCFVWLCLVAVIPLTAQVEAPELKIKTPKAPKVKLGLTIPEKKAENSSTLDVDGKPLSLLDSLNLQFLSDGSLILQDSLIEFAALIRPPAPEQVLLVRRNARIPARQEVLSFEAGLEKGDTLYFKVHNLHPKKLKQIRLLSGKVEVFQAEAISRKSSLQEYFVAQENTTLTLEMVNGFLFPISVDIEMRQHKRQKQILREMFTDTLWQEFEESWMEMDTTVEIFTHQELNLSPRRDITKPPHLRVLWNFPDRDNILAWAYWIGVGQQAIQKYEALKLSLPGGQEPLEWFSRNPRNFLPGHQQSQVDIIFCTGKQCERAERRQSFRSFPLSTLPGSTLNYAVMRGMPDNFQRNPLFTLFRNSSDLYDYPVKVVGLVLLGNPITVTRKVKRFELKNKVQLSLQ
jgi:hypothetical protein